MYLKYKSKKFNAKAFLSAAALLLPLKATYATLPDGDNISSPGDGRRSRSAPSSPRRPLGVARVANQGEQSLLPRRLKAFGDDGAESVDTRVSAATVRTIAQLNEQNAGLQALVNQLAEALEQQMPAAGMDQGERVQALEAQLAERDGQITQTVEMLSNLRSNFFKNLQALKGKRTHDQAITVANLVKGMIDTLAKTPEQQQMHQELKLLAKKLEKKKKGEETYKAQTERLASITWRMSKQETGELPKFTGNAETLRAVIDHIEANIRATELEIQAYWAQKVESVIPAAGAAEDQVSAVDAAESLLRFSTDEDGDGKKLLKSLEALKDQHDSESRKMFGGSSVVKAALVNKMLAQARTAVEELKKSIGATAEYLTVIRESGFKHNPELLRQMYGDRAIRLRQVTTEAADLDSSFVAPEENEEDDDGEE